MQESSRYNTIYDLASLRLHPDGSRVHQTSANGNDNLRLGKPGNKRVVYGPRRGWFARDAAGSMVSSVIRPKSKSISLKRRRSEVEGSDEDSIGEEISQEDGEVEEGENVEDDLVGGDGEVERGRTMKRKRSVEVKSKRARKRLRFKEDDTFIGDLIDERQGARSDEDKDVAPPPSDLLKAIHHHSAQFYKTRGVLFAPNKHQPEIAKKEREKMKGKMKMKMKKEQEAEEALYFKKTRSDINNSGCTTLPALETPDTDDERDEDDGFLHREGTVQTPSPASSPAVATPTAISSSGTVRNMYRVFEGSFLLGLGVLAQEKVAQLLESKAPQEFTDDSGTAGEILSDRSKIYPTPYLGNDYGMSSFYGGDSGTGIFATAEEDRWRVGRVRPNKDDKNTTSADLSFVCDGVYDEYKSQNGLMGGSGVRVRTEMDYEEFPMEDHALGEETEDTSCFTLDEGVDELDADQY